MRNLPEILLIVAAIPGVYSMLRQPPSRPDRSSEDRCDACGRDIDGPHWYVPGKIMCPGRRP